MNDGKIENYPKARFTSLSNGSLISEAFSFEVSTKMSALWRLLDVDPDDVEASFVEVEAIVVEVTFVEATFVEATFVVKVENAEDV